MAPVDSTAPAIDLLPERIEIDAAMVGRIGRQVPEGTFQQGSAANMVSFGMVMQGDSDLDQALEKLTLRLGGCPPDIFQDFVGFKEVRGVE